MICRSLAKLDSIQRYAARNVFEKQSNRSITIIFQDVSACDFIEFIFLANLYVIYVFVHRGQLLLYVKTVNAHFIITNLTHTRGPHVLYRCGNIKEKP